MSIDELEDAILQSANESQDLDFAYNLEQSCRRYKAKAYHSEGQKFYLFKNGRFGRKVSVQRAACGCLKWARGWEKAVNEELRPIEQPPCPH